MKNSTANVVTLIPPAVPAGPPPMNIRTSMPSHVSSRIESDVDRVESGRSCLDRVEEADQNA